METKKTNNTANPFWVTPAFLKEAERLLLTKQPRSKEHSVKQTAIKLHRENAPATAWLEQIAKAYQDQIANMDETKAIQFVVKKVKIYKSHCNSLERKGEI